MPTTDVKFDQPQTEVVFESRQSCGSQGVDLSQAGPGSLDHDGAGTTSTASAFQGPQLQSDPPRFSALNA